MAFSSKTQSLFWVLGAMNSTSAMSFLRILAPTLDYSEGPIGRVPIPTPNHSEEISKLVNDNIGIARNNWDIRETSWDFCGHAIV